VGPAKAGAGQAGRLASPGREGAADMALDLGRVGIWSRELRYNPDPGARAAAVAERELSHSGIV